MNILKWFRERHIRREKLIYGGMSDELLEVIVLWFEWATSYSDIGCVQQTAYSQPSPIKFDKRNGLCRAIRDFNIQRYGQRGGRDAYFRMDKEFQKLRHNLVKHKVCKNAIHPFGGGDVFEKEQLRGVAHRNPLRLAFCRKVIEHNQ